MLGLNVALALGFAPVGDERLEVDPMQRLGILKQSIEGSVRRLALKEVIEAHAFSGKRL